MNWKKSLFVVMLAGITVLATVGCGQAKEPVPATMEQTAPAVEKTTPSSGGTLPLPPEGTRPTPPEGMTLGERPPAPMMDLANAAEKLGVTEQQLREALGDMKQEPPDLAATAAKLGVSEDSLREALGFPEGVPPGGPPPGGPGPTGQGQ